MLCSMSGSLWPVRFEPRRSVLRMEAVRHVLIETSLTKSWERLMTTRMRGGASDLEATQTRGTLETTIRRTLVKTLAVRAQTTETLPVMIQLLRVQVETVLEI